MKTMAVILLAFWWGGIGYALAHSSRAPTDTSGISIPFVTHGEMKVLSPYRKQILALADTVRSPGTDLWTLVRFTEIQHGKCFWNMVPGTLTDEDSPFNECAHADLAGTKAILFKLRDMPGAASQANELISKIDYQIVTQGAAFIGCQYSGLGFNTAEFIQPHWSAVPGHWPSLLSLALAAFGLPLAACAVSPMRRPMGW